MVFEGEELLVRKRFFIASTGTGSGKTFVTLGLLAAAKRAGVRCVGVMPVATGAERVDGVLRNKEAVFFQQASSIDLPYEQINPVVFESATAPYIAAMQENKLITVSRLEGYIKGALLTPNDLALIEGASGWRVPLNDRETFSDLAKVLGFPVILVINITPDCLDYATLTVEAILRDGLVLSGWVANAGQLEMPYYDESLAALSSLLPAPLLGVLPWYEDEKLSHHEFDKLLAVL
jgi:dethiobiotin synthetase